MRVIFSKWWPAILVTLALWLVLAVYSNLTAAQNQNHFVYALDDAYIHLAIARNLSQFGVLGITRHEFSSTTSSLLWTLLLTAANLVVGVHELTPFWLNVLIATLAIFLVFQVLKKQGLSSVYSLFIVAGIVFLTPLPAMIFIGMEHTLHILLTLLFVYFAGQVIAAAEPSQNRGPWRVLLILAPLLAMIRYEGLFLVLAACILLAIRRRFLSSAFLSCIALIPIVVYGYISVRQGWYGLPNTLLIKGKMPDLASPGAWFLQSLGHFPHAKRVLLLIVLALGLYALSLIRRRQVWQPHQAMLLAFVGSALLHLFLVGAPPLFYRLEAYLIASGIFVITWAGWELLPRFQMARARLKPIISGLPLIVLVLLLWVGLGKTSRRAISQIPVATRNTYEEHYQLALFLKQYYPSASVALDDIGASIFYNDLRCLDLDGLGSLEVLKARRAGNFDTDQIDHLARSKQIKMAALHEDRYLPRFGGLPPAWFSAGCWITPRYWSSGMKTLTFYALSQADADTLEMNLKQFSDRLPPSVIQEGKYLTAPYLPNEPGN